MTNKSAFEKMEFLRTAIKDKKEIAAFHFNDTYCEFADKFYKSKSNKTTMVNFKRYMKSAADLMGLKIIKGKCNYIDRADFGVRNIWTIVYD